MIDTSLNTIRDAIVNARQIDFVYRDETGEVRKRTVCPHILGRKSGRWQVLAWQVSDDSKKGFSPGKPRWRCFRVDRISNVVASGKEWHRGWVTSDARANCVDEIDTVVDRDHAALIRHLIG